MELELGQLKRQYELAQFPRQIGDNKYFFKHLEKLKDNDIDIMNLITSYIQSYSNNI